MNALSPSVLQLLDALQKKVFFTGLQPSGWIILNRLSPTLEFSCAPHNSGFRRSIIPVDVDQMLINILRLNAFFRQKFQKFDDRMMFEIFKVSSLFSTKKKHKKPNNSSTNKDKILNSCLFSCYTWTFPVCISNRFSNFCSIVRTGTY